MRAHTRFIASLLFTTCCVLPTRSESNWPQFRGPGGLAMAAEGKAPVHFGPDSNVVWKTSLPAGHSSPCLWGERIFLTGVRDRKLETLCLDRRDGKVLWRRTAPAEKMESTQRIASPAASTPTTDGNRVYVYFGSCGLLAYDLEGKERWRRLLPQPVVEFGTGTSPILAGDLLILVRDQDEGSHLLALDKHTGKTAWRIERPEFRRGFATPFLWQHDGEEELIVPGSIWLKSYNVQDGSERWTYSGTSRVPCSSPTAGDGLLFSASWNIGGDEGARVTMEPFAEFARDHDRNKDGRLTPDEIPDGPVKERYSLMDLNKDQAVSPAEWASMAEMFARTRNALLAIRPGGQGDITSTHLAWKVTRGLPYVCSPLYYRGRVYTVKNGGLVSCYDARTGKPHFQEERLGAVGDYYASLVGADGKVYAASQNGVVTVFEADDSLHVLAQNKLGEQIFATPAVVEGKLYLRTTGHLYAFEE